jgi:hypothetical protein
VQYFDRVTSWRAVTWKTKTMKGRNYYKVELVEVKCQNAKLIEFVFADLYVSNGESFHYHQPWAFIYSRVEVLVYSVTH